jgi:hypothetical protein
LSHFVLCILRRFAGVSRVRPVLLAVSRLSLKFSHFPRCRQGVEFPLGDCISGAKDTPTLSSVGLCRPVCNADALTRRSHC